MGKKLTLVGFFAITASMVMTVYGYPTFATSGFTLVFFLLLAGFFWFLPTALCAAEMATVDRWEEGGIFTWVGNTLGEKFGFAAIFFQWFQITVGFVTMIYFILGAFSYILSFDALQTDPLTRFIGVLIIFWILTFSQLGGTKNTEKIAKVAFSGGVLVPIVILFILGIQYFVRGNQINVDISADAFFPDFSQLSTLVVFVSFILAYMGVEASASHVNEMARPKRDYPLAILILVVLAMAMNTIGGLTVAATIPKEQLSLSVGLVQTFDYLIPHTWIVRIIATLLALGVMGEISSWVVGPSRGLFVAAQKGILPKKLQKVNKHGVPVPLVMVQGFIVSAWAAILTFGGGGNNLSFLTAISLTVIIYAVGYILFFLAYFVLLFKKNDLKRAYHVPGGKVGKFMIAFIGLVMTFLVLTISFIPPSTIAAGNEGNYKLILSISFVITLLIPFIIYAVHDKAGRTKQQEKRITSERVNKFVPPRARGEHHIQADEENTLKQ